MTHTLILPSSRLEHRPKALQEYYTTIVLKNLTSHLPPDSTHKTIYANKISWHKLKPLLNKTTHLIIPGGEDIHPSYYNGSPTYPNQGKHNSIADQNQLNAIHYVINNQINYLGICRGLQLLNVALGGTLQQDNPAHIIPLTNPITIRYNQSYLTFPEQHPAFPYTEEPINCSHHQHVDKLGSNLQTVAYSNTGFPEIIEYDTKQETHKVIALQHHPEATAATETQLVGLYKWFYQS